MFAMGDSETACIFGAGTHSKATCFKELTAGDDSDFEFEHIPDETNKQWAIDSLNTLLQKCIDCSSASDYENLKNYVDIDSAIDYYIFTCLINGGDMFDKNYLLATFDGVKWIFSAYDMDSIFGNKWTGKGYNLADSGVTFAYFRGNHRLMYLIDKYDKAALKARYAELRNGPMAEQNILNEFTNFEVDIPIALKNEEVKIWPLIPGTTSNNVSQIFNYYKLRCEYLDKEIEAL
jgi:hypothetical protein